jgi:predicted phosphoadenosine phosphosulfate sulfurtransferase
MRVRKYLGINVLEAAKQRARHLFGVYDHVFISFSGGKDSLVLLELMDMVRIEMGIEKKLNVVFFDEELISDDHVKFMESVYETGRFNFYWLVVPLKSEKFILGKKVAYIQWDVTREWVRQPPAYATKILDLPVMHESEVFDMVIRKDFPNAVSCIGVRAGESRNRTLSVMKSTDMDMPYLNINGVGNATAKPIYDWGTKDIFKFLFDYNIKYAPVYDAQAWTKTPLRVATPFTNEGAKFLHKLREYDPIFYERITTIFPEMIVQCMYGHMLDNSTLYYQYGLTKEGILRYCDEVLTGSDKIKAYKQLKAIFASREQEYIEGKFPSRYPLMHIFRGIIGGLYKRFIHPMAENEVTGEMLEAEKVALAQWKKENNKELANEPSANEPSDK